jgi:cadmium resistance protein CadD (predicted permease)
MIEFTGDIGEAILAFIATNLDNIIILQLFLSQANSGIKRRHVIVGQYISFIIIILVSLPGYFGSLVLKPTWIGVLGLLPIMMGIKQLFGDRDRSHQSLDAAKLNITPTGSRQAFLAFFRSIISPQTYKVAAIILANSVDSFGVYLPLFASTNLASLIAILIILLLLTGVLCWLALLLNSHPKIAQISNDYGAQLVPFLLIGLGLFILLENGTLNVLFQQLRLG